MTTKLADYAEPLYGCRFCPMCKPKGEVSLFTKKESHTTRGRAMVMWRILAGFGEWDARAVELVYEAGLDSSSAAWCINHYPVPDYILAARAAIVSKGLAPPAVTALDTRLRAIDVSAHTPAATTLIYSDDASGAKDWLALLGEGAAALTPGGVGLAFGLGLHETSRLLAERLVEAVRRSDAMEVFADGPAAYWALSRVLSALDVALSDGVTVTFGTAWLAEHADVSLAEQVVYHDSAFYRLAALDFELPRRVLAAAGSTVAEFPANHALADDVGVEGGLHHLYPDLAAGVAQMRLEAMPRGDAHVLVTDCPDSAAWLSKHAGDGLEVLALPAWVRRRHA